MTGLDFTRQSYAEHLRTLRWQQGEHLLLAAPTGAGKSTLMQALVPKRRHVVILVSKIHDPLFQNEFKGWYRTESWPPPKNVEKVLLWPKPIKGNVWQRATEKTIPNAAKLTVAKHREAFGNCLNDIIQGQGWTVVVDELHYTTDQNFCNLGPEVALLHHQGRSAGNTVVNLTQRPAWVPKIVYSSITHGWIAKTKDPDDLRRLAFLGGLDPKETARQVSGLETRHDYLYVNPQGDAPPRIINSRK